MKKLIATSIAAAVALGLSTAAMAAPGFYVGVKGGYNNMEVPDENVSGTILGTNISAKQSTDNYFINVHGGYLFPVAPNFTLGPQIGFSYYGQVKQSDSVGGSTKNGNIDMYSLNLFAVGQYTFNQFYVEGRLGGVWGIASLHSKYNTLAYGDDDTQSSLDFAAGAGFGYYFTPNLSAGITYDHIFGTDYKSDQIKTSYDTPTMDSIGAQITYHF